MTNYTITIARGFGSGGKDIATLLASELNINCYDKRILTLASQMSGYGEEEFLKVDEKLRGGYLINKIKEIPDLLKPFPEEHAFISDIHLYEFQKKIILGLAKAESCIIVGKCADYILRDKENVMSIYIEAPRPYCRSRIMDKMQISAEKADELITKTDKYRADYYKFYTNGNYWTNPVNYDMTLNSERVGGSKECAEVIKSYLRMKGFIE
ncbi:MAG: cytidylate kinase-like family protein [Sphaerochaetaceae bacterium]